MLVALGAVGALVGTALVVAGAILLLLTGGDGRVGGRDTTLSTPTYALVTGAAGLRDGGLDATVRVRVSSAKGPVFVGVAPAATVEDLLRNVASDNLTDVHLSPLRFTAVRSPGTEVPQQPTSRQWTVSALGPGAQTVEVPIGDGGQRLVVMNADGSAGVDVQASVSLRAGFVRPLAVGLLIAGIVVAPVGGLLLVAGVRRTVRARSG